MIKVLYVVSKQVKEYRVWLEIFEVLIRGAILETQNLCEYVHTYTHTGVCMCLRMCLQMCTVCVYAWACACAPATVYAHVYVYLKRSCRPVSLGTASQSGAWQHHPQPTTRMPPGLRIAWTLPNPDASNWQAKSLRTQSTRWPGRHG